MKRIIAILLCLIMAVGAVACNKTEAPAETTQAPVNENPTEAPEATEAPAVTEAPETTAAPEKSGCGSSVAFSALAIVAIIGTAIISKKN